MNHCVLKIIPVALVNFGDGASNLTIPMACLVCFVLLDYHMATLLVASKHEHVG